MFFILAAPGMYAAPQTQETDKKALREQRREERRQKREERREERQQRKKGILTQETAGLEGVRRLEKRNGHGWAVPHNPGT